MALATPLSSIPADQWPLLLCRRHGLRWRRESSFKVEVGSGLLPQRYVLGVARETITSSIWSALLNELGLPGLSGELRCRIDSEYQQASTVYLGYEQGVNGANMRLYFEYWDVVTRRLHGTSPEETQRWQVHGPPLWPMGVGYKWPAAGGGGLSVSRYGVRPLLQTSRIPARAKQLLSGWPQGSERSPERAILTLLDRILASDATIAPVFLEVEEPGTPRASFDLSVHRYGLRLSAVAAEVQALITSLLGPGITLRDALRGGSLQGWITHVSAGRSRYGMPYACIYYEPERDD